MKKFLILIVFAFSAALLAGCGGGVSGYGDYFHDAALMDKVKNDIKAKAGTNMIFQNINLSPDSIVFSREDPNKKGNVDNFLYLQETGGWRAPTPVQLSGSGKIEDNVIDIDKINWPGIVELVKETEKRAKDAGMENGKVKSIHIHQEEVGDSTRVWVSIDIESDRKKANLMGDGTGKVTEFEIR